MALTYDTHTIIGGSGIHPASATTDTQQQRIQRVSQMKREDIIDLHSNHRIEAARIIPAPSQGRQWILFFEETEGRSYFLLNEDGEVCQFQTVDSAIEELQALGFKWAEVRF